MLKPELCMGIEKDDKILGFFWNLIVAGDLRINPVYFFSFCVLIMLLQNREVPLRSNFNFLPLST